MFVDIRHEELAEVSNDGPANSLIRNPFGDRFGLNVAELLQR